MLTNQHFAPKMAVQGYRVWVQFGQNNSRQQQEPQWQQQRQEQQQRRQEQQQQRQEQQQQRQEQQQQQHQQQKTLFNAKRKFSSVPFVESGATGND